MALVLLPTTATHQQHGNLVEDLLVLGQTLIPPLLQLLEKVGLAFGAAGDVVDVSVECDGVLEEHGSRVESRMQVAEEVLLFEAYSIAVPSILRLVEKVDVWGVPPRHDE